MTNPRPACDEPSRLPTLSFSLTEVPPTGRRRGRAISLVFLVLLALVLGGQFLKALPYEPRLIFENRLPEAIDPFDIRESSKKIDLGPVPAGGTITLPIVPRPGVDYVIYGHPITGDELARQVDLARKDRRDVHIKVYRNGEGFYYLSVEGRTLY